VGQSDLPLASAEAHANTFERAGWLRRKSRKNYIMMTKSGSPNTLAIPTSKGQVRRGTLQSLVRAAGMTDREYAQLFRG
jgi:hypothetical protein